MLIRREQITLLRISPPFVWSCTPRACSNCINSVFANSKHNDMYIVPVFFHDWTRRRVHSILLYSVQRFVVVVCCITCSKWWNIYGMSINYLQLYSHYHHMSKIDRCSMKIMFCNVVVSKPMHNEPDTQLVVPVSFCLKADTDWQVVISADPYHVWAWDDLQTEWFLRVA